LIKSLILFHLRKRSNVMASKRNQEIVESMPWYGKCKLISELSVGGMAVFLDAFPVTEGHMLFVPLDKKNGVEFCVNKACRIGYEKVQDEEWDGFNVGVNIGEAAGQTVDWPHVHLIPRMDGDVKDPAGGVRGVIPKRQNWRIAAFYKKIREELDLAGI